MVKFNYAELKNLTTLDKTFRLDLLSVIVWPFKYPTPMWSGFMQMVQTGDFPGKSSVSFLPMIDLNASDMTCVYSTLNFGSNQAKRYDITAILTFDQPLYWKAFSIIENENPVGTCIIQELEGKNKLDHTFRRKKQAITLGNKVQANLDGEPLHIDSQLPFQRCTNVADGIFYDISEIFRYELCGVPSSIFEITSLPREPQKSTLADYMWNLIELKPKAPTETYFVLNGGSLIHLPWTKGATVDTICMTYVNYVNYHYKDATVVFDGYPSVPTTKDVTHIRRTKEIISPKVNFNNDTPIKTKKDEFLSNSENKQLFINTLEEKRKDGHAVIHAEDYADLQIVLIAIEMSEQETTTVIGEDTNLLILLCYHSQDTINQIYFKSEPKQNTHKMKI
ncbi:unnamed protein product [Mytilus coruscus]|uniref:Uncharacterized protein n=1 Tax=Mytilus coruscus TaxID=42192 RepID=A0A6J8C1F5_MYTCO|nr:unnamed protein product [Mytilus coruscus]